MRIPANTSFLLALSAAPLVAQNTVTIPAIATDLPGNAALSMPVRWSQGTMQVLIESSLLPNALQGNSINALVLRRPAFFDEPPYPAAQPTLTVSMGFTTRGASSLGQDLVANRPSSSTVVFGPAPVTVAATPAHGAGDVLAADLIRIPLTSPLPVTMDNLFIEFEAIDMQFTVSPHHWVDAVHLVGGNDTGLGLEVGNGGCGGTQLLCAPGSTPPQFGATTDLVLRGAPVRQPAWILVGLTPQTRPLQFGFGGELLALGAPGCFQWTAVDVDLAHTTSPLGGLAISLPFPSGSIWTPGLRIGVQAIVLDPRPTANPAGLVVSNGVVLVMDEVGVGGDCATVFAPSTSTISPWQPYVGLLPVLHLEY